MVQELLKFIPGSLAARYPVVTNILLSIGAALIAVWQDMIAQPVSWTDWVLLVGTVSAVAAIIYNQLIGRREVLQPRPMVRNIPVSVKPGKKTI